MKNKQPQIRFMEYYKNFEPYILGEHTELITKGTSPKNITNDKTVNFIKIEDIINGNINPKHKISIEEHENYLKRSRLKENDILFSIAGTLGRTALVERSILPANTNQALAIIRGYDFDTKFLMTTLSSKVVTEYIRRNPTVGAQPNLSLKQVNQLVIYTPEKEEQQKIGEFFKQLDDHIALQQRHVEQLKQSKKGFLQKMFPKEGELVPEVRFDGFSGEWEATSLGNLGEIMTGSTPKTTEKEYWSENADGYVWITPTDINKLRISDSERKLTDKGWRKARVIPKNSILVTSIASIGKNAINTVPVAFNQQINAIVPKNNDSHFILSMIEKDKPRFKLIAGQTATPIINKTLFMGYRVVIPKIKEQQKIGEFFKQLDDLIDKNERELELLQETKKGFLQKMFV